MLKAVADEKGELPSRTTVEVAGPMVTNEIRGQRWDPEAQRWVSDLYTMGAVQGCGGSDG